MTLRTLESRGPRPNPPKISIVRPLTRADLVHLNAPRAQHRVTAFRESHHRLARLVASGVRQEQVLEISGYSAASLSRYRNDPAFIELVAQYKHRVDEKYAEVVDEMEATAVSNMRRMERMVEQHLENAEAEGALIPLKTLATLISDRMDRFGYSKKQVNLNLNATLATKLETAINRTREAKQIEGSASRLSLETPREMVMSGSPSPSVDQSRAERGATLRLERAAARNRA